MMRSKLRYTQAEADEIIALITEKLNTDTAGQKSIRAKIRRRGFWADDYGFGGGYTVENFLSVAKIIGGKSKVATETVVEKKEIVRVVIDPEKSSTSRSNSDESYVIDLCDEVLKQKAIRQHRFDFLLGDAGTKLPVDAYYPLLQLVIEFKEKQHTEAVKFFDRRETVSGMGRGEQRKLYDQRRKEVLPKHNIKLIELGYNDFEHARNKKLVRNREADLKIIREKLKAI